MESVVHFIELQKIKKYEEWDKVSEGRELAKKITMDSRAFSDAINQIW